jgi:hypothetical protein
LRTKPNAISKVFSLAVLVAALALILVGMLRSYKVHEAGTDEFGMEMFYRVADRELVEDATFRGVILEDGLLYTTYDRLAPRGKSSCPT